MRMEALHCKAFSFSSATGQQLKICWNSIPNSQILFCAYCASEKLCWGCEWENIYVMKRENGNVFAKWTTHYIYIFPNLYFRRHPFRFSNGFINVWHATMVLYDIFRIENGKILSQESVHIGLSIPRSTISNQSETDSSWALFHWAYNIYSVIERISLVE